MSLKEKVDEIIDETRRTGLINHQDLGSFFSWKQNVNSETSIPVNFATIVQEAQREWSGLSSSGLTLPACSGALILTRLGPCRTLEDIYGRTHTKADIRDMSFAHSCKGLLDSVERCALGFWTMKNTRKSQKDLLESAYAARISFYHSFFVEPGAKHASDSQELVDVCDYLRSTRASISIRQGARAKNMQTMDTMLSRISIQEIWAANPTYNFLDPEYVSQLQVQQVSQLPRLAKKLYKAIQGQAIIDDLRTLMSNKSAMVITRRTRGAGAAPAAGAGAAVAVGMGTAPAAGAGAAVAVGMGAAPAGNKINVQVTQLHIDLLPWAAETLSAAREWETLAYTSCLGTTSDAIFSHDYEKNLADLLASIDFESNPDDIFAEIELLYRQKMLKKYLKYKEKYLNLKKQLNLL
jgi:hypothetical protein